MTQGFKDHFSDRAAAYAMHRPVYPRELIHFLASEAPAQKLAWDCGCGSGQMSVRLAERFDIVIATDASAGQIANATPHPRISYRTAPAERSGLDQGTADLIVAAQAAHWFDLPAFYGEARRVARKEALIALVTYDWIEVNDAVDVPVRKFYSAIAGYWPPERRLVEDGYASIPFPFQEIKAPQFVMKAEWTVDELLGYIGTWSAVRRLEADGGSERRVAFEREVRRAWSEAQALPVRWKLSMRVGRMQ